MYPTRVNNIPLSRKCLRKMCSTPQKQPAAKVANSVLTIKLSAYFLYLRRLTRRHRPLENEVLQHRRTKLEIETLGPARAPTIARRCSIYIGSHA